MSGVIHTRENLDDKLNLQVDRLFFVFVWGSFCIETMKVSDEVGDGWSVH